MPISTGRSAPLGWTGVVKTHHFRVVYPSQSGTQVNMRRGLITRLVPRYDGYTVPDIPTKFRQGLQQLNAQRPNFPRFSSNVEVGSCKSQEELANRLASYDASIKPAEGKAKLPALTALHLCQRGRSMYSADDVMVILQRIIDIDSLSLEQHKKLRDAMNILKRELSGRDQRTFSVAEVRKLVARLSSFNAETHPAESRGTPALQQDIISLKGNTARPVTGKELSQIIERLSSYDAEKYPPGSPAKPSSSVTSPEQRRQISNKKMDKKDLEKVIDRLSHYNPKKWPPESLGVKTVYLGIKPINN